jgi:hypothetical protein
MNRKPYFVQSLVKGGGVIPIDSSNEHYFNQMINVKKVPDLIYLDEDRNMIGTIDLSPQDAEVFVEQKLEDLVKREDSIIKREAEAMEKEFDLAEREQQLNIRENELNNAKNLSESKEAKVDRRSAEYRNSKKEN